MAGKQCGNDSRMRLFNGTCYYFEDRMQLTFSDAIDFCGEFGYGSPASILSTAENNFIASQVCNILIVSYTVYEYTSNICTISHSYYLYERYKFILVNIMDIIRLLTLYSFRILLINLFLHSYIY